jgi:hypothetical protein
MGSSHDPATFYSAVVILLVVAALTAVVAGIKTISRGVYRGLTPWGRAFELRGGGAQLAGAALCAAGAAVAWLARLAWLNS